MLGKIGSLVARVAAEAGSVVGLRFGTEEPRYTSEKVTHGLEIRKYGPRIAAETTVFGDEDKALRDGFRRLAGYIFGGNHGNATIEMTVPVARQSGPKIAMTAPVSKTSGADGGSAVRFFMPAGWTMDTLPEPNDDEVGLVTVPGETVAVLRFTGYMRVQLRMNYEINRQLQRDSDLSLADYHVLNALTMAPDHTLQVTDLAAVIGWERSRLSHHLRRLSQRGLTKRVPSEDDGRATDAVLTKKGMNAMVAAAPGHARLVKKLFFEPLPNELVSPFTAALEHIQASLNLNASLPPVPL